MFMLLLFLLSYSTMSFRCLTIATTLYTRQGSMYLSSQVVLACLPATCQYASLARRAIGRLPKPDVRLQARPSEGQRLPTYTHITTNR